MDTFSAIENRRSVKHFDPDFKIPDSEVESLLSSAILSPTAFNLQHWRIVNVVKQEQRKQMRAVAWDQAQITDASLLFVMCGDLNAWSKEPERYWENAPQEIRDMLIPAITQYYKGNEQVQRDDVMRSCGFAGQTIMLAAKAMGYDSCPMSGFDFDAVSKIINLPEDHVISYIITIGKANEPARGRGGQLPLNEVVKTDKF